MTRYVIGPDVAMRLARDQTVIGDDHQNLAPTLLRSQLLSLLYQAVSRGEMTRRMPSDGSTTCAGCEFDCSATAYFRKSLGKSPTSSDGPTPMAPSTLL